MGKKPLRKILIVDDNPAMVKLSEKALKNDGYLVITAFDGAEAVNAAKAQKPDCILLDVLMPGMDGDDVVRELRKDPDTQDIPIIFATVAIDIRADKGSEMREVDGESYRAFAKPIHQQKTLSVIRKTINRRIHNSG